MEFFYSYNADDKVALFDENEATHCLKVLRKKQGDSIHFIDGKGSVYSGVIEKTTKSSFECSILTQETFDTPKRFLHIAVAPVKNADRLQWMIEKCTETGTSVFTFLQCKNNERGHLNIDKLRRTCIAACKQSGNPYLPIMNPLTDFTTFIQQQKEINQKWIAHCADTPKENRFEFEENFEGEINVLIGPEGDFTPIEIDLAVQCGYKPLSMGILRLRTETAAIWASVSAQK